MRKVPKEDQCVCARDDAGPCYRKAASSAADKGIADSGGGGQRESGDCQQSGARSRSGDGGDGIDGMGLMGDGCCVDERDGGKS